MLLSETADEERLAKMSEQLDPLSYFTKRLLAMKSIIDSRSSNVPLDRRGEIAENDRLRLAYECKVLYPACRELWAKYEWVPDMALSLFSQREILNAYKTKNIMLIAGLLKGVI